ncbi:MAG TPA: tRNA (adenosine(37)-N6)-threonylcarbamoyltransferase complex ATPase subunit type 1 TsaE [Saprospiraceae bacterium]|nr:tRNA (adenosine(37)-N6)-threonylcarbamoyltransferase complex ATPase subunit type 1 TsaE [Saprospiraceae bacterium]
MINEKITFVIKDVIRLPEYISAHLPLFLKNSTLLLEAPMGAGKTTFVSALANLMGSMISVSSPTFSIVNEYQLASPVQGYRSIIHMDLYRLQSIEEILRVGLEDYLYDPKNLVIIEWPALIAPLVAEPFTLIEIAVDDHLWRTFTLEGYGQARSNKNSIS